jgi:tRNA-2-methylthio-N6-dimethylallyladenosine synthase
MTKKLFIKTFGCQMNEYDSAKMADVLNLAEEIIRTDTPEDADIILFNTCSVREKAQEKVFSDLGRVRELKKNKPDLVIGVGGCVASQEGKAIVQRAPYVDVVFGPQTLHRLPDLLQQRRASGRPQVDISFPEIEKFDHLPPARVEGASAFVSIMEGCSKYCSYCVVPYTRGEEVSRRFDDVLTEVAQLASQGVREITLLGQNVNAYRGKMADGDIADFALLIEYIAEFEAIERIRYVTSHPKEFTQRLIDTYAKVPKLVDHLYLPAQHGSDTILAAMNFSPRRNSVTSSAEAIWRRFSSTGPHRLASRLLSTGSGKNCLVAEFFKSAAYVLITISPRSENGWLSVMVTSMNCPIRRAAFGPPSKFTTRLFSLRPCSSFGSRFDGPSTSTRCTLPTIASE